MTRFARYVAPILLYAACIYYLSSRSDVPSVPVPHVDKAIHFIEYAILAVLCARALHGYGVGIQRSVGISVVLCALYGATDEYHQRFTTNRYSSWSDLAADVLGAAAGAWAWSKLRTRRP